MRKPPHTLAHGETITQVGGAAVDSLSPVGIAIDLLSKVTGGPIEPGTCDGCHFKTTDPGERAEVWESPALSPSAQVLTKAGIMLTGGVLFSLLFGGRIATIVGLIGGNWIARPIVDSLARASGPEVAPPPGARILPSSSAAAPAAAPTTAPTTTAPASATALAPPGKGT